jgi:RNA recognition motif-containing protein
MFAAFGDVTNIKIIVEPTTNQSRGMAFVEMKTIPQAKKAIETLNGRVYDGRTLKANFAIPMRPVSAPKAALEKSVKRKDDNKDLRFKDIQLAKKARNQEKRKGAKPPGFVY